MLYQAVGHATESELKNLHLNSHLMKLILNFISNGGMLSLWFSALRTQRKFKSTVMNLEPSSNVLSCFMLKII